MDRPVAPSSRRRPGGPRAAPSAPVYWERTGSAAALRRAPLGAACGEVAAGAVVRERRRCRDPFGDVWAAARDAEGGAVWVRLSDAAADGDAQWRRVFDAAAPDAAPEEPLAQPQRARCVRAPVRSRAVRGAGDAAVFERCWRRAVAARDWNTAYQELLERHLFVTADGEMLSEFMQDFENAVADAALTVVHDFLRPSSERIGTPVGVAGAFLCGGLLVCMAIDEAGDDAHAWRVAAQAHLARQVVALEAPKQLLCTPPCALVTFAGFRMTVTAVPPVDAANVVSCARLERDGHAAAPKAICARIETFGRAIGLCPHVLASLGDQSGGAVETILPADAAVFAGFDRRLYILDVDHLLPTIACASGWSEDKNLDKLDDSGTPLRFRPEFLFALDRPLSCAEEEEKAEEDTDGRNKNSEAAEDKLIATDELRDRLIPTVADILGMQSPVTRPRSSETVCTLCERTMTDELRFVVCRGEHACCRICTHCYTQRLSEQSKQSETLAPALFADAVRCGSTARRPKGLVLEPSVTNIFHANGLNMRFLPAVYYSLPQGACFAVAHYCEVEMIARAAVRILRERMRRTAQSVEEVHAVCQTFLLALLQSSGAASLDLWAKELGPALRRVYGVQEPFDTAQLDVELLYERVAEISGICLDPLSVASLHSEKPFLRLAEVRPIVKLVQPPHVVDEDAREKMRAALKQSTESLLLFWIGFSVTELENGYEELLKQPFFLSDKEIPM